VTRRIDDKLPLIARFEKSRSLPNSITAAVLSADG